MADERRLHQTHLLVGYTEPTIERRIHQSHLLVGYVAPAVERRLHQTHLLVGFRQGRDWEDIPDADIIYDVDFARIEATKVNFSQEYEVGDGTDKQIVSRVILYFNADFTAKIWLNGGQLIPDYGATEELAQIAKYLIDPAKIRTGQTNTLKVQVVNEAGERGMVQWRLEIR